MSTAGPGPSPPDGPGRPPRWQDRDWWLGRTPEQRARREQAWAEFRVARQEAREALRRPADARTDAAADPGADAGASAGAAAGQPGGCLGAIGEAGRILTIVVTLPIIAGAIFGPIGLLVALPLAILLLMGRRAR